MMTKFIRELEIKKVLVLKYSFCITFLKTLCIYLNMTVYSVTKRGMKGKRFTNRD